MTEGIDEKELKRLEELSVVATPAPWRTGWLESYEVGTGEPMAYVYRRPADDKTETAKTRIRVFGVGPSPDCDADAALIAEGRNAIPRLIAEIRRLAKDVDSLEEMLRGDDA